MSIPVLPPDIDSSDVEFAVVRRKSSQLSALSSQPAGQRAPGARIESAGARIPSRTPNDENPFPSDHVRSEIRFGLGAIKGVGTKAVGAILAAREKDGPFKSIFDFCERVDSGQVNRACLEALDQGWCLRFDRGHAQSAHGRPRRRDRARQQAGRRSQGRSDVALWRRGYMAMRERRPRKHEPRLPSVEWTEAEMLAHEKAVLGFYVTRHPLSMHEETLAKYATASTADLKRFGEGAEVVLGGMISQIRTVITKNGRNAGAKMGIITCEDLKGSVEVVVFPRDLDRFQPLLALETLVFFRGQVDRKREDPSLRVSEVIPLESADEHLSALVIFRVQGEFANEKTLRQLRELMTSHRGDKPAYLELWTGNVPSQEGAERSCERQRAPNGERTAGRLKVTVRVGQVGVKPTSQFRRAVEDVLGPGGMITVGSVRRPGPAAPPPGARAAERSLMTKQGTCGSPRPRAHPD